MAGEIVKEYDLDVEVFTAAEDISAGDVVTINDTVSRCLDGDAGKFGVALEDATANSPVRVAIAGVVSVRCNSAVNKGNYVVAASTGAVTKADIDTVAGVLSIVGVAMDTTSAAGTITILLK